MSSIGAFPTLPETEMGLALTKFILGDLLSGRLNTLLNGGLKRVIHLLNRPIDNASFE